jgi:hypothetical protein
MWVCGCTHKIRDEILLPISFQNPHPCALNHLFVIAEEIYGQIYLTKNLKEESIGSVECRLTYLSPLHNRYYFVSNCSFSFLHRFNIVLGIGMYKYLRRHPYLKFCRFTVLILKVIFQVFSAPTDLLSE